MNFDRYFQTLGTVPNVCPLKASKLVNIHDFIMKMEKGYYYNLYTNQFICPSQNKLIQDMK